MLPHSNATHSYVAVGWIDETHIPADQCPTTGTTQWPSPRTDVKQTAPCKERRLGRKQRASGRTLTSPVTSEV